MTAYATTMTDAGDVARVEWLNVLADSGDQSVRNHWRWTVEPADQPTIAGEDLTSAMDVLDPDPIAALQSLGSFLSAYAEGPEDMAGSFPGLDPEVAGTIGEHIALMLPETYDSPVEDPLLTIRATEVDQDGRGPNEWLITAHPNPDAPVGVLIVATSRPESLLHMFGEAGVHVTTQPFIPGWEVVQDKAARVRPIVEQYATLTGQLPGENRETILSDLFADMQHLAYVEGVSWDEVTRRADRHVEAERAGE